MSAVRPALEIAHPAAVPRLLVELPSWPRVFFGNLRDLLLPRWPTPLELRSAPAPFWPDVFVERTLPWNRFAQSVVYHVAAGAVLIGLTHLFALQPRVVQTPSFDHSQVIYYQPSEYLLPLDTRDASATRPAKADPEFSRQPVISVPRESDNHSQTIVTPPNVKLKRDVALPNVVAWSDTPQKPRLAIPPAPLTPAAEITRIAPTLENSVAPPPVDARVAHRRTSPTLQEPVAAPPSDLRSSNAPAAMPGLQPALIAPPPSVDAAPTRKLGDLSIAPSPVIAPAPQLPVAAQRTNAGGGLTAVGGPQVVPPPPSLSASGLGVSSGSSGRMIALNLHPAVSAPADPPASNRRGTFAATPEGHAGASGNPGSLPGTASGFGSSGGMGKKENGGATSSKGNFDLPAGLYVGPAARPAPVAGDPASNAPVNTVNPNLMASVRPPRVTTSRPMQPESASKLSEPERTVFGNRRFYSVTLNMPNLNSAGGSWIIRFAEISHGSSNPDPNAPAPDLSQPMATRKVDPAYPLQLMQENVHGTVILYAVIHADGTVGNVRVLRGVDERLDRFASEAVAQWKFDPATRNGAPVDVEATFQIPFRPARVGTNF
ncbi:MAG TPA: TonB family protein [Candidatus Dormibacteraeota bacterium]|nr:TonB family protein [Candidatus Dormibacteraeota bacterium]